MAGPRRKSHDADDSDAVELSAHSTVDDALQYHSKDIEAGERRR